MNRYTCTCVQCAVVFSTEKNLQRYCSVACRVEARRVRHSKTCKQCGAVYEARDREVKAGKANYCSTKCYNASKGSLYPIDRLFELAAHSGLSGVTSRYLIDTLTPGLTGAEYHHANKLVASTMTKLVTYGKLSKSKAGRIVTYRLRINQLSAIGKHITGTRKTGQRIVLPGSTPVVTIKEKTAGGFVGPVIVPDGVKFTKCPSPGYGRFGEIITATEAPRLFRDIPLGALA